MREQCRTVGQILREGVVKCFAVFGKRPTRREEHAAVHLPDDLPVIGPLHRDGKRGPLQSWLVTPIGHDCVHLAGAKVKVYLFAPTASTFISSLSLLLDGFTFHSPTKGSFAAHTVLVTTQAPSSN